jgi:lipopolysaccharide/colanic/teichoic acid biosynthesis glycosyltransferase
VSAPARAVASVLAAGTVSARQGLLVVGDEALRGRAVEAGGRGRRPIVTHLVHPDDPVAPAGWRDLVVDADLLNDVRQRNAELFLRARRVWVASGGEGSGATFERLGEPLPVLGRILKRALDLVLSAVGLVLAVPLLLVAIAAVRLDTPGPALFRQVRVGANGRRFLLYKIRTMRHGNDDSRQRAYVAQMIEGTAERCGDVFKLRDDPRITKVGRVLRRFSVDEVPQLWNVLKGDMSLVGPRPPLPGETELYSSRAWERLRVKPGLTGLWQVSGRCALSFEEMVSLDVRYWQRWSLALDLLILLRTPWTVLKGTGAA